MKKVSKILTTSAFAAVALAVAACGNNKPSGKGITIQMWTGFGKDYTGEIEKVIKTFNDNHKDSINIVHTSQNNYNKLETNISNSIDGLTYPHLANGYPDHFAEYIHKGVMLPLNNYIDAYNQKHNTDLLADFEADYLTENQTLYWDVADPSVTVTFGLPFNKSTEIMVVNGYYLDVARLVDPSIARDIVTWDDLKTNGPKIINALETAGVFGTDNKYLIGKVNASNNSVTEYRVSNSDATGPEEVVLQDISAVSKSSFRVLGYDDGSNAFITMLHQWNSGYTDFDKDMYFENEIGKAIFWRDNYKGTNYKAATKAGLEYFKELYDLNCFGLPTHWSLTNFCTDAFEQGNCMFTIGSSGGLSNSTDASKRIEIHAIPYKDAEHKFVISQGTSLGLFSRYSGGALKPENREAAQKEWQASFDAMVELCTGELQGSWVSNTGYFPSSKSAMNSQAYKSLLEDTNPSALRKMYQNAAELNKNEYTKANGWTKFVDPGFLRSSQIRATVNLVLQNVMAGEKDIDTVMNETWNEVPAECRR